MNGLRRYDAYTQWNITQPKNENLSFAATWMDLEGIMVSKLDRDSQILYDVTDMCNLN